MKEYQIAIVKLPGTSRDDEETLTDLLNERARSGWDFEAVLPLGGRIAVVFARDTA